MKRTVYFMRLLTIAAAAFVLAACSDGDGAGRAGGAGAEPEARTTIGAFDADTRPHPDFSLTMAGLVALVAEEAEATRAAVVERPQLFLDLIARVLAAPPDLWVLVDKQTPLAPDHEPDDLIALTEYSDRLILNRNDLSLRQLVMPALLAMVESARLDGVILDVSSTYRSYAYQEGLFERWVAELGETEAARVSARAGTSQHQLGTTVDFGSITPEYADTRGGRWLAQNAWRYGFSLSYPDGFEATTGYSFEPWHYRYVGTDATRLERDFFGGIQQYMLEFLHTNAADLRLAQSRVRD